MIYKHAILTFIFAFIFSFLGCQNTTEPVNTINNGEAKLSFSADKTSGPAPLTVNFSAKIIGKMDSLSGHVPDYIFYPGVGLTVIRYALPDTSVAINLVWNSQISYPKGTYNAVLLYQGIKNGKSIDLLSDTIHITAN